MRRQAQVFRGIRTQWCKVLPDTGQHIIQRQMPVLQTVPGIYEGEVVPRMKWTAEELALFDKYDPETVAKITGRSVKNVRAKYYAMRGGVKVFDAYYCPICGKEFFPPSAEWVYKKIGRDGLTHYYCSWTCMRSR